HGALEGRHVLVASAGKADQHFLAWIHARPALRTGKSMCRFDRRKDSLGAATLGERLERFVVGRGLVPHAPGPQQQRMFWSHTGIVETGRDRLGFLDL